MTTIFLLAERIQRTLAGGNPSSRDRIRFADIKAAIPGAVAAALKFDALSTNYQTDGESIPDGTLVATFEGVALEAMSGDRCRAALPIAPMILPERIGVFSVYPPGEPDKEFVPIPVGLLNSFKKDNLVNSLNRVLYTHEQNYAVIHKNIIDDGVSAVDMQICCVAPHHLSDFDVLPLPADLEETVITSVYQILGVTPATSRNDGMQLNPKPAE